MSASDGDCGLVTAWELWPQVITYNQTTGVTPFDNNTSGGDAGKAGSSSSSVGQSSVQMLPPCSAGALTFGPFSAGKAKCMLPGCSQPAGSTGFCGATHANSFVNTDNGTGTTKGAATATPTADTSTTASEFISGAPKASASNAGAGPDDTSFTWGVQLGVPDESVGTDTALHREPSIIPELIRKIKITPMITEKFILSKFPGIRDAINEEQPVKAPARERAPGDIFFHLSATTWYASVHVA
mgnify:FL=1